MCDVQNTDSIRMKNVEELLGDKRQNDPDLLNQHYKKFINSYLEINVITYTSKNTNNADI